MKNYQLFGDRLLMPHIVLSDATSTLGTWKRAQRLLSMSRRLCVEQPWVVVGEVLRHEMAHQYVDEVMKVANEPSHGPTFQRVCEARGIDGRACGMPVAARVSEGEDKIQDKIRRLLALAGSNNEHEAELAMSKAHELMVKYNVSVTETPEITYLHLGDPTKRRSTVERYILGLLTRYFFVKAITLSVAIPSIRKNGNVYEIMGTRPNLLMAEYVYQFLLQTVDHLWLERRRGDVSLGVRDKVPYQVGVIEGFSQKLELQRQEIEVEGKRERGGQLVWVGSGPLGDFYDKRYPRRRSVSMGTNNSGARSLGAADGKNVVLNRPITSKGSGNGGFLGGGS